MIYNAHNLSQLTSFTHREGIPSYDYVILNADTILTLLYVTLNADTILTLLYIPTERESPADLAKFGLSDARIVTWKSVPYKRMLEYLFYVHNPTIQVQPSQYRRCWEGRLCC